jgi:hypothetical protein
MRHFEEKQLYGTTHVKSVLKDLEEDSLKVGDDG